MTGRSGSSVAGTEAYVGKLLSVVIPAHNEAMGIGQTLEVINRSIKSCGMSWEVIVVDDGSHDGTFARLRELAEQDTRVKGIRLSRNFGKEAAMLAGLKAAKGEAVVTIDADLQHPPQLIPAMIEEWQKGAKVIDAVKRSRAKDGVLTRVRAKVFNTIMSKVAAIDIQKSSDFKLLDHSVVRAIVDELPERQRFYRGLSDWIGFPHATVPFDVEERATGEGKWSLWQLVGLATTAIVAFTSAPLRIVTVLGFITLVFGFFVAFDAVLGWFQGRAVTGFATTIITLLILGSFIMISLGIVGEYIANIYEEIKRRPPYLIEDKVGLEEK